MAFTVENSGTQAATIGTEHSLGIFAGPKSFLLVVDMTTLANGDELELRAKGTVLAAGARRQLDYAVFAHAQADPVNIFGPYPAGIDCEFTLKQTAGTGRSFDWAVWSL